MGGLQEEKHDWECAQQAAEVDTDPFDFQVVCEYKFDLDWLFRVSCYELKLPKCKIEWFCLVVKMLKVIYLDYADEDVTGR